MEAVVLKLHRDQAVKARWSVDITCDISAIECVSATCVNDTVVRGVSDRTTCLPGRQLPPFPHDPEGSLSLYSPSLTLPPRWNAALSHMIEINEVECCPLSHD